MLFNGLKTTGNHAEKPTHAFMGGANAWNN